MNELALACLEVFPQAVRAAARLAMKSPLAVWLIDIGDDLGPYSQDAIDSSPIKPAKQNADLALFSSIAPSLNNHSSLTVPQRNAINQLLAGLVQTR